MAYAACCTSSPDLAQKDGINEILSAGLLANINHSDLKEDTCCLHAYKQVVVTEVRIHCQLRLNETVTTLKPIRYKKVNLMCATFYFAAST